MSLVLKFAQKTEGGIIILIGLLHFASTTNSWRTALGMHLGRRSNLFTLQKHKNFQKGAYFPAAEWKQRVFWCPWPQVKRSSHLNRKMMATSCFNFKHVRVAKYANYTCSNSAAVKLHPKQAALMHLLNVQQGLRGSNDVGLWTGWWVMTCLDSFSHNETLLLLWTHTDLI